MDEAFEIIKTGIDFFGSHLVFFNLLFAIVIVFFQRRDPKSVWAWLLLLYFTCYWGRICISGKCSGSKRWRITSAKI